MRPDLPAHVIARRARRLAAVTSAWALLTAGACVAAREAQLCWNRTESLPVGVYSSRPVQAQPGRGAIVSIAVPAAVRQLVIARGYLSPAEPLFKRVLGLPGDHVCLGPAGYQVNGVTVGPILGQDRQGRPLPSYTFCGAVPPDTYWLGTDYARSFDSRYFGPVKRADLLAQLVPRWTF